MSEQETKKRTEWGLRHTNGYIRWCASKIEAEGLKSGRLVSGRRGDWANHELVKRTVTTTWGAPEVPS